MVLNRPLRQAQGPGKVQCHSTGSGTGNGSGTEVKDLEMEYSKAGESGGIPAVGCQNILRGRENTGKPGPFDRLRDRGWHKGPVGKPDEPQETLFNLDLQAPDVVAGELAAKRFGDGHNHALAVGCSLPLQSLLRA